MLRLGDVGGVDKDVDLRGRRLRIGGAPVSQVLQNHFTGLETGFGHADCGCRPLPLKLFGDSINRHFRELGQLAIQAVDRVRIDGAGDLLTTLFQRQPEHLGPAQERDHLLADVAIELDRNLFRSQSGVRDQHVDHAVVPGLKLLRFPVSHDTRPVQKSIIQPYTGADKLASEWE